MTVYLCGASIDENGRASGGKAGDQTGREVRRVAWYLYGGGPWSYVIRMRDASAAEKLAKAAEQGAANNNIGYDQSNRNDLFAKIKKGASMANVGATETDCTAFAATCAYVAGASGAELYSGGNLPYSGNFDAKLLKAAKCDKLTAAKYLSGPDHLKRGDILVKAGHHAEVVVSNGAKAAASAPAKPAEPQNVANVIQAAENGTEAQEWHLEEVGEFVKIVNASGLCLDVTGGRTEPMRNGRAVYVHRDNGTDAQLWRLVPSIVGGVQIASKLAEGYVLDVERGTTKNRAYATLHARQAATANIWAQSWHIVDRFGGGVAIVNAKSLMCLDANPTKIKL